MLKTRRRSAMLAGSRGAARSRAARRRGGLGRAAAHLRLPDAPGVSGAGARPCELPCHGARAEERRSPRPHSPAGNDPRRPARSPKPQERRLWSAPGGPARGLLPRRTRRSARVRAADDRARGRLQRPRSRSRPGGLRQRIRHRSVHRSGRLLREGQPARRSAATRRFPRAKPNAKPKSRLRKRQSNQSETRSGLRRRCRKPRAGRSRSPPTSRPPTRSASSTATSCSWRPTTDSYDDLEAAEETAVRLGHKPKKPPPAKRGLRHRGLQLLGRIRTGTVVRDSPAFNHPGTVITASAGDDGYLNWTEAAEAEAAKEAYYAGADYPASSPHVVAVGGTHLSLSASGTWKEETVWNDDPRGGEENYGAGGGGCSTQFAAPEWQRDVPDWAKVGCGTGTEPNAPSPTSPPTPTPTAAWPSTTRSPTSTKKSGRESRTRQHPARLVADRRHQRRLADHRLDVRARRRLARRRIPGKTLYEHLAPACCTPSPQAATANATTSTPPATAR